MPDDQNKLVVDEVRSIFRELFEHGFDAASIAGATDAEIDMLAEEQGAPGVPIAVREILRFIGRRSGMFASGGDYTIPSISSEWKNIVLEYLDERPKDVASAIIDSKYSLVIWGYLDSHGALIDGAEVLAANPRVFEISESGGVVKYDSVTMFFREKADTVKREIDRQKRDSDRTDRFFR